MNIKLPTFEECHEIEREDRTPLEAFVWEHEPSDQVSLDEFRKLLGAVIEAERAQLKDARELLAKVRYDSPIVDCRSFHHRPKDRDHPFCECAPAKRWADAMNAIAEYLAKEPR